jgi:hypothetical protein
MQPRSVCFVHAVSGVTGHEQGFNVPSDKLSFCVRSREFGGHSIGAFLPYHLLPNVTPKKLDASCAHWGGMSCCLKAEFEFVVLCSIPTYPGMDLNELLP